MFLSILIVSTWTGNSNLILLMVQSNWYMVKSNWCTDSSKKSCVINTLLHQGCCMLIFRAVIHSSSLVIISKWFSIGMVQYQQVFRTNYILLQYGSFKNVSGTQAFNVKRKSWLYSGAREKTVTVRDAITKFGVGKNKRNFKVQKRIVELLVEKQKIKKEKQVSKKRSTNNEWNYIWMVMESKS